MTFRVAFFWGMIYFVSLVLVGAVKSRPVGGELCRLVKRGACDCRCLETQTTTWGSLAFLYKKLFIRSFDPVELDIECNKCAAECARHIESTRCEHGKCDRNGCSCDPCWKGESCDQSANDFAPIFEQHSYRIKIESSAAIGDVVLSVGASDEDNKKCPQHDACPCASIAYSVSSGNEANLFSIDENTGTIKVSKDLRTSEGSYIELNVVAENEDKDARRKAPTKVFITVVNTEKKRHRRSAEHHIVRRSVEPTVSPSGVLVIAPVVQNNTFYKPADEITFNLSLSHNQSAGQFAPDANLQFSCSSTFLSVKDEAFISSSGPTPTVSSGVLTFAASSFTQQEKINVVFKTVVKSTIHPLANLYLTCKVLGAKEATSYQIGPVSSSPPLYAVFPKVTLVRLTEPSKSLFGIRDTLHYRMSINMPCLDFPLFVEVTSAINDFSFMSIHSIETTKGSNIGAGSGGNLSPIPKYHKSLKTLLFNDRGTVDFGNLTVNCAAESEVNNKIEVEWKVNVTDHPLLANGSKHWNGAGLSSGSNMLYVAQQAIYVNKIEPTVSCTVTATNDTIASRFSIDDLLYFTYLCQHTNTSTADAKDVTLKWYSTYLEFVSASYTPPGGPAAPVNTQNAGTMLTNIVVNTLTQGQEITGTLEMKVRDNIFPLVEMDLFCALLYKNNLGQDKMKTIHKPEPPAIAGVPVISLNITNPLSCYRVGSIIDLDFKVLLRKMNTTLLVEFITPVNSSLPMMSIVSISSPKVGSNIENHASLAEKTATCKSTINDTMNDRCTLDFGTTKSIKGTGNDPANEISIKFQVILNDHHNVTNGSKYWPAVGVRGGSRMMWIGEVAVTVCDSADPKPVLKFESNCYVPGTSKQCCEASLKRQNEVQFNITVSHDLKFSEQHADNVKLIHMIPPYVIFKQELLKSPASRLILKKTTAGPELEDSKQLRFLDKLSFSYLAQLDPYDKMATGDIQATSIVEVSYLGHDPATVLSRKAGICCTYNNAGASSGKPAVAPSSLPEYYNRGFLLTPSKSFYVCSENTAKTSCFYTNDGGVSWIPLHEQVGRVIGNVGETLYAISKNKRAYMKQESRDANWYAIPADEWQQVKKSAETSLKVVPNHHPNTVDPTIFVEDTASNRYGGNKNGIYFQKKGESWAQKALWKCCGAL